MKKMFIVIPRDESAPISVETEGFSGKACIDATAAIEMALGSMISVDHTSEYYEKEGDTTVVVG